MPRGRVPILYGTGEQTAKSVILPGVARRPAPEELDRPLTPEQLRQLEHSLALLSESSVLKEYRRAREACRIATDVLPRAANVQALVAAWKTLRRRRPARRMPERG